MSHRSQESEKTHEQLAEYWTPERRNAAREKPYEPARTEPSPGPPPRPAHSRDVPGSAPAPSAGLGALGAPTPVPRPEDYPWCTIGKLFFISNGIDYVGSACVIARDGLLTVAHNLYDVRSRSWSKDLWFYPAYDEGSSVYGAWKWNKAWIKEEWYQTDQEAFDVGLIRVDRNSAGQSLGDVVGWLGYTVDRTPERAWIDVGYPSDIERGRRMIAEEGYYTRMLDHNQVVGKQGSMTGGASGGPWLLYGDLTLVNGLHSFRKERDYPGEVFSPYFSTWVADFIRDIFP